MVHHEGDSIAINLGTLGTYEFGKGRIDQRKLKDIAPPPPYSKDPKIAAALKGATDKKMGAWAFSKSNIMRETAARLGAANIGIQIAKSMGAITVENGGITVDKSLPGYAIGTYAAQVSLPGERAKVGALAKANVRTVETIITPLSQAAVKYESALIRERSDIQHYSTLVERYNELVREGTPGTENTSGDWLGQLKGMAVYVVIGLFVLAAFSIFLNKRKK